MQRRRDATDDLEAIDGVDSAALGMDEPPDSAPPGAEVDPADRRVPGAHFGDVLPDESKPWFTTLAAESDQAGVSNEPGDRQPAKHAPEEESEE